MSKEPKPAAEELVARMAEVRTNLDRDTDKLHQGARRLGDWKGYVRAHPWATMGAAAAVGFLLAPRKRQTVKADTAALEELLKSKNLVLQPTGSKKAGLAMGLAGMGLRILGQYATREIMQAVQDRLHPAPEEDDYEDIGEPLPEPRRGKPR